jgi:hypothetical protein
MPKKKAKSVKPVKDNRPAGLVPVDFTPEINNPTKESLQALADYIEREKDEDKRAEAELAYEEAMIFYYSPTNDKQEEELLLAKMIWREEDRLIDLTIKADAARFALDKLDLDRKVHAEIMKKVSKKRAEEWQYNFSEDYYTTVEDTWARLDDEVAYLTAWIEEARKLIKTEKFRDIPDDFFRHCHYDSEGVDFMDEDECEDEDCADDCECGCGCEC